MNHEFLRIYGKILGGGRGWSANIHQAHSLLAFGSSGCQESGKRRAERWARQLMDEAPPPASPGLLHKQGWPQSLLSVLPGNL